MAKRLAVFLVLIAVLIIGCAPVPPEAQPEATKATPTKAPVAASTTPASIPLPQLAKTDETVFTIANRQTFSGKEGEPRPNWLGWGAEVFIAAPDGGFWIADSAASPQRLLHYSAQGDLLRDISLENLVVYPFDLASTQNSLWVLDISAQAPKIVRLDQEGIFLADIQIPEELLVSDGQRIFNGVFDLTVGEAGELLLIGINGVHEVVDASGTITYKPIEALTYYGHTYQVGSYGRASWGSPIRVDGKLLQMSPEFVVEGPVLGFRPDGSFAVAGSIAGAQDQSSRQVRYYSPTGELLGIARQHPPTFYKDWNHHLAFGPDGAVYQLLSNPDHSVQILRLGFAEELPLGMEPGVTPTLTPTALAVLQPPDLAATDEQKARKALLAFFAGLSSQNYGEAAAYYGGEKIEYAEEMPAAETSAAYWEEICSSLLWCLPVADITGSEQATEDEFIFWVVFVQPDGRRFEVGACCGGDPAASPPVWQFAYPVKKIDGNWKVMRGPVFTP